MKITLLTGKTYNIEQQIDFPIKIVKSPRAKKLTLRIDTREHLPVLSIPRYCPQKKAVEFVLAHKQWINDSLNRLPRSKPFENGDTISLFGKEVTIIHAPERRLGAKLETDQLLVSGEIEFLHRRVKDFIKKKAQNEFYKRSNKYAKKLGETINGVTIKDTKSRWGSCSTLQNINYSWRIALAPDFVINYLMAHEVAHLRHPNHSRCFWDCVASLYPEYEQGEQWLKEHGKDLYLYE